MKTECQFCGKKEKLFPVSMSRTRIMICKECRDKYYPKKKTPKMSFEKPKEVCEFVENFRMAKKSFFDKWKT